MNTERMNTGSNGLSVSCEDLPAVGDACWSQDQRDDLKEDPLEQEMVTLQIFCQENPMDREEPVGLQSVVEEAVRQGLRD